jgi:integrase
LSRKRRSRPVAKKKERGNGSGTVYARKNKDGKVIGYRGSYFTPDGKRRYVSAKNKTEARRALRQAMADADRGLIFDAGTLTVGEYLKSWLSDCLGPLVRSSKMEYSTFIRYAGIVNNHITPVLGRKKLRDLGRAEVRALYAAKGKELSPRSVDYIHVTLQKALSQAVRDDLIPRNVAEGERPRSSRNREEIKALSPAQVRALLAAASGERNEALYVVAVHTGLRQGELLGLRWADVDLEGRRLSVRRALKVTDTGLDFGPPKNKASLRSVPLTRSAAAALRAHRTRQNEERLRLGDLWSDHDLVFPNRVGGPTDHNNLYRREYKKLLKRAGLGDEGFTFHSLRHTFATELFNQRKRPKIIQSLLGHSSIVQTMDTYSHLLDGVDDDEVGGLDEAFG